MDSPQPPAPLENSASNQPDSESTGKLLLVDGHALVYRAYHALPPDLRTSSGEPTNAVLGFTQMLMDTLRIQAPSHAVVTFDKGRTFRHESFPEYKAQRGAMPDDLRDQLGRVREVVDTLGIPIVELAGYEADDLIGTLSSQAEEQGLDTVILTADNDQHQLVTDKTRVIAPGGYNQRFSEARVYDREAVIERYGFEPKFVPDFKALVGDKSDNIPNVPGIGDKTAASLIVEHGTVENILEHFKELKPKVQEKLRSYEEQILRSKALATIICDVPIQVDLEESQMRRFDREKMLKLLQELEFRSLVTKLYQVESALFRGGEQPEMIEPSGPAGKARGDHAAQLSLFGEETTQQDVGAGVEQEAPARRSSAEALSVAEQRVTAGVPTEVRIVRSGDELSELASRLRSRGRFVVDVEATSPDDMDAQLVGISIALESDVESVEESFYIPLAHLTTQEDKAPELEPGQLSCEEVIRQLGPLFADPQIPKDGHNLKYDSKVLQRAGFNVEGLGADTMIAAHLLGRTSTGLKDLAFTELGVQMVPIEELIGKGRNQTTIDYVATETVAGYAGADVAVTERLRHRFTPLLKGAGLLELFTDVEMPLVNVLAGMELVGVAIDVPWLQKLSTEIHKPLSRLQDEIYEEAKHPFNINSPQQLGSVLFEELQLPGRRRTQKGYSTDRDVLDALKGLHPIVDLVVEYRQLIKLKNTYIDALPLLVRRDTGRVHTSFNQGVVSTGRLSSTKPNLQNIPIRTEIGRDVRKAFIAGDVESNRIFSEDSVLLSADYSQIELRLLAHMADEERLVAAFEAGQDIHAATAAEIMGVPIDKVDSDSRRLAKTINFGVLYGMGSYGLARDSGLSQAEAAKFIELYWSRYPAVRRLMDQTLRQGRELGYVSTLDGRRRNTPELLSRNGGIRQAAERMAINAPVQGTAADIIKKAMNRIDAEFDRRNLKCKMLLQVHDELLFEVPESELEEVADLVCETMEGAAQLKVPVRAELKAGKNWGDMKPLSMSK